jgi:hypothetical protein
VRVVGGGDDGGGMENSPMTMVGWARSIRYILEGFFGAE